MLKKLGIIKSKTKSSDVFNRYIEPDFMHNTLSPSDYLSKCWKLYQKSNVEKNNALNGSIFELIIATLLVKEKILPLHLHAKVAFVPNVIFDAMLYSKECGPIAISMKTSLRERYKQADLEAIALKYVHRKAENYLLTMNQNEAISITEKICSGDILGLDRAILVTSTGFDEFIDEIKSKTLINPGNIDIITASKVIIPETLNASDF